VTLPRYIVHLALESVDRLQQSDIDYLRVRLGHLNLTVTAAAGPPKVELFVYAENQIAAYGLACYRVESVLRTLGRGDARCMLEAVYLAP
jgi:hypothetical protein